MAVRALKLPDDLLPLADMLVRTFQYPENPQWSIQSDEQEDIAREIRSLRRLWPLFRVAQALSKPMRDLFRGCVWEEDGKIGAVVIAQRRGSTSMWTIGTVGVLPEFRRRGLARQLLTHTMDDIRDRGGTHIVLAVIDQNVPAYSLYRSLGFEHYSSQIEYHRTPGNPIATSSLPVRYEEHRLDRFDWQGRYALASRITPQHIVAYEPVTLSRYRPPAAVRLLAPLLDKTQKRIENRCAITQGGTIVAHGGYRTTKNQKGTSDVWIELDPEHPDVALPLLSKLSASLFSLSPTFRVQFSASSWMPALSEAAIVLKFERRLEYHWLGLVM
jgi:ribosomal protein S18 acetylase RimI-like enzyme